MRTLFRLNVCQGDQLLMVGGVGECRFSHDHGDGPAGFRPLWRWIPGFLPDLEVLERTFRGEPDPRW